MNLIVDIIGIVALIFASIAVLFKEKKSLLLFFMFYNVLVLVTYILLGQLSGSLLLGLFTIRSMIYYIYALKDIKPNVYLLITINILGIALYLISWDNIYSIILLVNFMMTTYSTWQNNVLVLKSVNIVSCLLIILYDFLIGAYMIIISEVVLLLTTIVGIIRTYNNSKKEGEQKNDKENI